MQSGFPAASSPTVDRQQRGPLLAWPYDRALAETSVHEPPQASRFGCTGVVQNPLPARS